MLYVRKGIHWKIPEQINRVVCLYVILFRIPEGDTATEKDFDIVLHMSLYRVLL